MSDREKKLLMGLGAALFAVVTLFGYKFLTTKQDELRVQIKGLESKIWEADTALKSRDSLQSEIDWLAQAQKEPKEGTLVGSQLETFVTSRATQAGLTVNRPKILPNDESGVHYHRAKFQVSVSGQEAALYRWLTQLHSPRDFRAITALRLSPNREDDTQIDAVATIEEWFVPSTVQ